MLNAGLECDRVLFITLYSRQCETRRRAAKAAGTLTGVVRLLWPGRLRLSWVWTSLFSKGNPYNTKQIS